MTVREALGGALRVNRQVLINVTYDSVLRLVYCRGLGSLTSAEARLV